MKGTDKRVYVIHWTEDMARMKEACGYGCGAWTSIIGKP